MLFAARAASAQGQGETPLALQLAGDEVRLEVTPPVATLRWLDDDGDGRLTAAEMARNRQKLRSHYARAVVLSSATREVAMVGSFEATLVDDAASASGGAAAVRLRARHRFSVPPRGLVLDYALFPPGADGAVRATAAVRTSADDGVERVEQITLTRAQPRAVFFFTGEQRVVGEQLLAEAGARRAGKPPLTRREGLALLMLGLALMLAGLFIARRYRQQQR